MKGDILTLETAERIAKLEKRNKELEDGFKASTDELCEYATKIDKAIKELKDTSVDMPSTLIMEVIDYAIHILQGDDTSE